MHGQGQLLFFPSFLPRARVSRHVASHLCPSRYLGHGLPASSRTVIRQRHVLEGPYMYGIYFLHPTIACLA